tara:strand:- start:146 stop:655 length:510 start_codon:yes stop_codon:yes gene_type:complete
MARGNFTNNRGPKTLSGRLNQLRGLRNVGIKIATDKQYLDQVYDDGMDFVSKRKKREASKIENEFNRVVRDNIIKPKDFNKNYEAPKEWLSDYEAKKAEHELSLREAQEINKHSQRREPSNPYSRKEPQINYARYGYAPGVWLPSKAPSREGSSWYSNYARLQKKKSYY